MNLAKPGAGFNVNPSDLDPSLVADYQHKAVATSALDVFARIVPATFTDAFSSNGDLLQVLLISILFGYALSHIGEKGKPVYTFLQSLSHVRAFIGVAEEFFKSC